MWPCISLSHIYCIKAFYLNYFTSNPGNDSIAKPISISKLNLTVKKKDEIHFECTCSKGTYIRSLARDIGYAVNSGAHLIDLRRTSSGDFHIKNAKTVDEWIDIIKTS